MRTGLSVLLLPFLLSAFLPAGQTTGPRIVLANEVHDYGTIAYGSNGRCSFPFTNTGDAPLIIVQCRSSCGCLVPFWIHEPVPPGGTSTIDLRYDTSRTGHFTETITVESNDRNDPLILLRITGTVLPDTTLMGKPPAR